MFVCVYVCMCVDECLYFGLYVVCMCIYAYVCMCVRVSVCTFMCMFSCLCLPVYVCVCVCMYMCVYEIWCMFMFVRSQKLNENHSVIHKINTFIVNKVLSVRNIVKLAKAPASPGILLLLFRNM